MDDPSLSDKHRTKLLVIRRHSEGATHGFIAQCLKLQANTITNHLKEWLEGGLPAVVEDHYYRPSSAMEPFMACLRAAFAAAPVVGAQAAVARIKALTGVPLSESQARTHPAQTGPQIPQGRRHPRQMRCSIAVRLLPAAEAPQARRSSQRRAQSLLRRRRALRHEGLLGHALELRTPVPSRPRPDGSATACSEPSKATATRSSA